MIDKTSVKFISWLVTTGLFGSLWYIIGTYLPANQIVIDTPDKYMKTGVGLIICFLPVGLSILWSLLKKRYLWISSVFVFFAYEVFIWTTHYSNIPVGNTVYVVYVIIAYISCFFAIIMDRREKIDFFGGGGSDDTDPCPNGQCY